MGVQIPQEIATRSQRGTKCANTDYSRLNDGSHFSFYIPEFSSGNIFRHSFGGFG
jgi:hypothetical protein